jgi:3,4-dihydroxy 2-butanone 4-phosphate synthase/GTP cyclohydrolase II
MKPFNSIEEAIGDIRQGKMIVVVDDEYRENEGDIIIAAEKVTPEAVNFMAKHAGGLICMPVTRKRMDELQIDYMVQRNTDSKQTAFTVSVDWHESTTGISAYERAQTILHVIDPKSKPKDFTRPGHIFPLIAKERGVLERAGHTEAAVDLARMAGLYPAGVICEIMNEDGSMARVPDLTAFVEKHKLKFITVADLISYRRRHESIIERKAKAELPTAYGDFKAYGYVDKINGEHHVALVKGNIHNNEPVLVRIHSECLTGDVFGSKRCDCGEQLHEAMRRIEEAGRGVLLYLRQEGRGIGLINKLKAYELQEKGMDTVEANIALGFRADLRDYSVGAEILVDLGVKKIILMTNNPTKVAGLSGYGLEVVERQPIEMACNEENHFYMQTKLHKLGHLLHVQ